MKKQKYDTPFERFLTQNGLTGKQVSVFLAVSDAFISQLRQGKVELPDDKFIMLQKDGRWDLSMFPEKGSVKSFGDGIAAGRDVHHVNTSHELDKMLDALNESLKQNSRLIGIIEKMQDQK